MGTKRKGKITLRSKRWSFLAHFLTFCKVCFFKSLLCFKVTPSSIFASLSFVLSLLDVHNQVFILSCHFPLVWSILYLSLLFLTILSFLLPCFFLVIFFLFALPSRVFLSFSLSVAPSQLQRCFLLLASSFKIWLINIFLCFSLPQALTNST